MLTRLLSARWDSNPRFQHTNYSSPSYQDGLVLAVLFCSQGELRYLDPLINSQVLCLWATWEYVFFAGQVGNDPTLLGLTDRRCTILASDPFICSPYGIRTHILALEERCPVQLNEGTKLESRPSLFGFRYRLLLQTAPRLRTCTFHCDFLCDQGETRTLNPFGTSFLDWRVYHSTTWPIYVL